MYSKDPETEETPYRPRQNAPKQLLRNSRHLYVFKGNGAGATVIPSGSWLHEVDEEDFARNVVFKKQTGGPAALFRPPVCLSVEVLFQFRQLIPHQEAIGVAHL
jgi:hypothetical protein